jgi:hypothetical protein
MTQDQLHSGEPDPPRSAVKPNQGHSWLGYDMVGRGPFNFGAIQ